MQILAQPLGAGEAMALDGGRDIDRLAVLGRAMAPDGVESLERKPDGIAARVA